MRTKHNKHSPKRRNAILESMEDFNESDFAQSFRDSYFGFVLPMMLHFLFWGLGFAAGCFSIWFLLEHFDLILIFISNILRELAQP